MLKAYENVFQVQTDKDNTLEDEQRGPLPVMTRSTLSKHVNDWQAAHKHSLMCQQEPRQLVVLKRKGLPGNLEWCFGILKHCAH